MRNGRLLHWVTHTHTRTHAHTHARTHAHTRTHTRVGFWGWVRESLLKWPILRKKGPFLVARISIWFALENTMLYTASRAAQAFYPWKSRVFRGDPWRVFGCKLDVRPVILFFTDLKNIYSWESCDVFSREKSTFEFLKNRWKFQLKSNFFDFPGNFSKIEKSKKVGFQLKTSTFQILKSCSLDKNS